MKATGDGLTASQLFTDARLKVERANKHISDVKSALDALEQTYTSTVERNAVAGVQTLVHTVPYSEVALQKLSLIVGDVIHNLHAALDFSWYRTIKRFLPDKISSKTKFPVRETRDQVEAVLRGIEVDTRHKRLFDLILTDVQPYRGGHNSVIWTIHKLDISDKHLLLLDFTPHGHIRGITLRDRNGGTHRGSTMSIEGPGPYVLDFEDSIQIEDRGKLSVAVTLNEAGIFKPVPIDDLLPSFSQYAFYVVKLLENL
jgi:hypothetical protein